MQQSQQNKSNLDMNYIDEEQQQFDFEQCYGQYIILQTPSHTLLSQENQYSEDQQQEENRNQELLSKKIIKKRAKKVSKFVQQKLKQKLQINRKLDISLFQHIQLHKDMFYIFGDQVVELDYNLKPFEDKPIDLNQIQQFKSVKMVEKIKQIDSFELNYEMSSTQRNQFQFIIDRFMQSDQGDLYQFGLCLKKYQNLSVHCQNDLNKHREILTNPQNCFAMIEKQNLFYQKSYEWIRENVEESDFFTYTLSKLNQENMTFQTNKSGISNSLVALLGGDFDTISQVALRKGGLHFLNSRSRFLQVFEQIQYINSFQNPQRELEFELITFDQIIVPCKATVEYLYLPICKDDNCYYRKTYKIDSIYWMNFYSTCKLIKYHISPNIIMQVIETRKKLSQEQKILYESYFDDFVYTTESEIFLEKYYQKERDRLNKEKNSQLQQCSFIDIKN
ncbi:hypothetical protein ABPG72_006417 [Tetrahymena utriculariae]